MRHRRYSGFVLEGWRNPAAATILTDRSRFKNNGAFTGATWVQLLTGAWVMDFTNAANLVTIPAAASINDMPEFTWCGWVKIVGDGGNNAGRIFDKAIMLFFVGTPGVNGFLDFQKSFSSVAGAWKTSDGSFLTGIWKYVEMSYNSTSVNNNPSICINGVASSVTRLTAPVGTASPDLPNNLIFGNRAGADRFLNGYLSAPKIYNYLRTEAQALAAFTAERAQYGV